MKKLLPVLLALVMLFSCFSPAALALDQSKLSNISVNIEPNLSYSAKSVFDAKTMDKVDEKDGVLTVETDYGLVFTCALPEYVSYLTQDLRHDLATYLMYYSDPGTEVKSFIEDEMHLNIFTNTDQCLDVFFYAYEEGDSLSSIVGNANELTEADAAAIVPLLGSNFDYGMVGDQLWFIGDYLKENNVLLGITFVGGHIVKAAMYNIASDDDVNIILDMLASVKLSMK